MIEFILSKFGILLFAVAVAGILVSFGASMKDVFVADEGMQISSVISKQLKEMSDSQSLCVSKFVTLPRFIDVFGNTSSPNSTSLYYFMDINIIKPSNIQDDKKFVVFTLVNKRTKKPISLESFITDSDVSIEEIASDNFILENTTICDDRKCARIDPTETNVIYMVKVNRVNDAENVEKKLFFIPCKYEKNQAAPLRSCFAALDIISRDYQALCVPTADPYDVSSRTEKFNSGVQ